MIQYEYYINDKVNYHISNDKYSTDIPFKVNQLYRSNDLPSLIVIDDFTVKEDIYFTNGEKHRDGDKPAHIVHKNGVLSSYSFFKKGLCHRDGDLPAVVTIDDKEEYWIYGIKYKHTYVYDSIEWLGSYNKFRNNKDITQNDILLNINSKNKLISQYCRSLMNL